MSKNYVDYDVLAQAKALYSDKAGQLEEILSQIISMNNTLYPGGWDNLTAKAFVERFDSDHKVAIQKVIEALNDISNYINSYSSNRMSEDEAGASAIR